MHLYYKIPPEVAEAHYLTDTSPRHPDGWYLITPPKALRIARALPPRPDGSLWDIPSAMSEVGAVGYTSSEAMASARGEKRYMMNTPDQQSDQQPQPEPEQSQDEPEQPQGEAGMSTGEDSPTEESPTEELP